jgi:hypothetical protein
MALLSKYPPVHPEKKQMALRGDLGINSPDLELTRKFIRDTKGSRNRNSLSSLQLHQILKANLAESKSKTYLFEGIQPYSEFSSINLNIRSTESRVVTPKSNFGKWLEPCCGIKRP